MDTNVHGGSVCLFPLKALNVKHPLFAVDSGDLSFTSLVESAGDNHLVFFTDGKRANLNEGKGKGKGIRKSLNFNTNIEQERSR